MKKRLLSFVMAILLLLASCGQKPGENPEPSSAEPLEAVSLVGTDEAIESSRESIEDTSSEPAVNVLQIRPISLSEQVSGRNGQSVTVVKKVAELPDTLELDNVSENDLFSGATTRVASISLDLQVPEGCFLYGRKALYKDTDNDLVTLSFVDEYLLTVQETTMEEVEEDIRRIVSEGNPNLNPPYVIFSFRVFRKEYLPIENLYRYALNDSCEYRTSGAYYIAFGKENDAFSLGSWLAVGGKMSDTEIEERVESASAAVASLTEQLKKESTGTDIYYESDYPAYLAEQKSLLFYGTRPIFRLGTCSMREDVSGDGFVTEIVSDPDASVLNDAWFDAFQSALKSLQEDAAGYNYPEAECVYESALTADDELRYCDEKFSSEWGFDSDNDHAIRAYCYANAKVRNGNVDLKDVIVATKDISNGNRAFYTFLRDGSGAMTPFERGINQITGLNLDLARNYVTTVMR
ncbi:MAG: hypothetical protein IK088_01145 [Lachnospiraceae bacterium]|nr:hypothetical protein [Lachnospiraceae bacterium]